MLYITIIEKRTTQAVSAMQAISISLPGDSASMIYMVFTDT